MLVDVGVPISRRRTPASA